MAARDYYLVSLGALLLIICTVKAEDYSHVGCVAKSSSLIHEQYLRVGQSQDVMGHCQSLCARKARAKFGVLRRSDDSAYVACYCGSAEINNQDITTLSDEAQCWYRCGDSEPCGGPDDKISLYQDVDECQARPPVCRTSDRCTNTYGNYHCDECDPGYAQNSEDATICSDEDECLRTPNPCGEALCFNEPTTYRCGCHEGFVLREDGQACLDIDECETNNGQCQEDCNNVPGSYQCACQNGYQVADTYNCEDIDECLLDAVCDLNCTNTPGGYRCQCFDIVTENENCPPPPPTSTTTDAMSVQPKAGRKVVEVQSPPTSDGRCLASSVIALSLALVVLNLSP